MASTFWKSLRSATDSFRTTFTGQPQNVAKTPRDASPLQRAFAAGAVTGFPVTNKWEELGHDTSWNYVAVNTVARMWALADVLAYDHQPMEPITKAHASDAPAEQRTPNRDHEAVKLLERPNPVMNRMQFMYILATHLRLTGGFVVWEVRGKDSNKPVELWPLPRSWMQYITPTAQYPLGGFYVRNSRGTQMYWGASPLSAGFFLDYRECIICQWPHPLYPGESISPLSACGQIIDIMEKTDTAVWASLMNAPRPGMLLSVDSAVVMDDAQLRRYASQIEEFKGGPFNAGKVLILQGVQKEEVGTKIAELDAVNVRDQNMKFGLGIQGVPDIASGMRSDVGTYSGDAASFNAFAEWGIQPDLDLAAGTFTHRWQRYWGDEFELEFQAKRMDDPTLKQKRADQIFAALDKQAATPNEWRASVDLPPMEGGDVPYQPPQPAAPLTQNFHNGAPADAGGDIGDIGLDDTGDDLDLDLDLPDEDGPGDKRPELQRAFSMNGNGRPH